MEDVNEARDHRTPFDRAALRTESPVNEELVNRLIKVTRLLHGVMGKVTEAGELMDNLKKHIFYNKPLDVVNIIEELGDDEWYGALVRDAIKVAQDEVQRRVIEKLTNKQKGRYKDGVFTSQEAINRDHDAEREVLEKGVVPQVPIEGGSNIVDAMNEIGDQEGRTFGEVPMLGGPKTIEEYNEITGLEEPTANIVSAALLSGQGWRISNDRRLHLPGDISNNWAARWYDIKVGDGANGDILVKAPHWLSRRIKELRLKEGLATTSASVDYRSEDDRLTIASGSTLAACFRALTLSEINTILIGLGRIKSHSVFPTMRKLEIIRDEMIREEGKKRTTNEPPPGSVSQS